MAWHWQMSVTAPGASGSKASYGDHTNPGVISIASMEMLPLGTWGEMTFTAIPSLVDIRPRDGVTVSIYQDGDPESYLLYSGVIVVAGSPRGVDPVTYRAVANDHKVRWMTVGRPSAGGGDVAWIVRQALAREWNEYPPVGGRVEEPYEEHAPDTGFSLGVRYPALETFAEFLTEMAATVGAFIVPPGQTYSYDGRVWLAGEVVPAVEWGLDRFGRILFRRPQRVVGALSESAQDVVVNWRASSSERVIDRVRLVYAAGYDPALTAPYADLNILEWRPPGANTWQDWQRASGVAEPLSRQFVAEHAQYYQEKVVALENPGDYMLDAATSFSESGDWQDPLSARDGNEATYAALVGLDGGVSMTLVASGHAAGVVYVDVHFIEGFREFVTPHGIEVSADWSDGFNSRAQANLFLPFNTEGGRPRVRYAIPLPKPVEIAGVGITAMVVTLRLFSGAIGTRVHRFDFLAPDVDSGGLASEYLAGAHHVMPTLEVGSVEVMRYSPHWTHLLLTPSTGSSVELPVRRVEYSITSERGIVTTYHVGDQYDGELLSQRAVLEALAQRAAGARNTAVQR